ASSLVPPLALFLLGAACHLIAERSNPQRKDVQQAPARGAHKHNNLLKAS
ncbi:hypothetical protein CALVIDRAFT_495914, partial [Calocera viscosa TUFC12733]